MDIKSEILQKHVKILIEKYPDENYFTIAEMIESPEWKCTMDAMEEYAQLKLKEIVAKISMDYNTEKELNEPIEFVEDTLAYLNEELQKLSNNG